MLKKYKNVSDIIRLRPLRLPQKYMTIDHFTTAKRSNILVQLERLREWLRSRFPVIAGLVAFTAGVFSIIFAVVKLSKGAAAQTAKTMHSIGKTIGRILSKFGPMIASIGSFIISLLSFLAQLIMWVANNLWILLIAVVGYLWKKYGK